MTIYRQDMSQLSLGDHSGGTAGWLVQRYGGTSSFVLLVQSGGLFGKHLSISVGGGFWANGLLEWTAGPATQDGDLLVVWEYHSNDLTTGTKWYGPAHRIQDVGSAVDAVSASLDYIGSVDQLGFVLNGANNRSVFGSSTPALVDPPALDTLYVSRLNLEGRVYKMRTWALEDDEPTDWTLEPAASTSSEPTTAGRPGMVIDRLEPTGGDGDGISLHLLSFSDDPSIPAPLFLEDFNNRGRAPEGRRRSVQV